MNTNIAVFLQGLILQKQRSRIRKPGAQGTGREKLIVLLEQRRVLPPDPPGAGQAPFLDPGKHPVYYHDRRKPDPERPAKAGNERVACHEEVKCKEEEQGRDGKPERPDDQLPFWIMAVIPAARNPAESFFIASVQLGIIVTLSIVML